MINIFLTIFGIIYGILTVMMIVSPETMAKLRYPFESEGKKVSKVYKIFVRIWGIICLLIGIIILLEIFMN